MPPMNALPPIIGGGAFIGGLLFGPRRRDALCSTWRRRGAGGVTMLRTFHTKTWKTAGTIGHDTVD